MIIEDIDHLNLKVLVFDTACYALQAINSYLAWDRRTRVTFMTTEIEAFWQYLRESPVAELPDVLVFDADHLGTIQQVKAAIKHRLHFKVNNDVQACW